ncbi:flagellar hook-length control protein FliK [Novipirellula caenicola]|uniref:Flagellar hook-length control protein-like C-terminal domain-containing protein n=1 Tax=Novipirellula caenicola TaxID=1536901 RepID=A0ABP9W3G0_9BACT
MSESQATSGTAALRSSTQSRLRSFGTQLQSIDPSNGIIDAFADVFAQISAIESPQSEKSVSAPQQQSPSASESSSQSEQDDDAAAIDSHDVDDAEAPTEESAAELPTVATTAVSDTDEATESEADDEETAEEDRIVAESDADDNATANDAAVLAAATVQTNTEDNDLGDETSASQTTELETKVITASTEQDSSKQTSSQSQTETSTDPLAPVSKMDTDTEDASDESSTAADTVSADVTSETETNSSDHQRDSRHRRRDHFGPVGGGDRANGNQTSGGQADPASVARNGQTNSVNASATATLPIPDFVQPPETVSAVTANVSTAVQQAVEAITSSAAAASAGAARMTANANSSSATSSSSATGNNSGAIGGSSATPSADDATTQRTDKSGTSSTTDLISRAKLIQRVSRAFQHLGPDGGNVRLRLAPAELGTVRLEMQIKSNKIQTRVVAETEAAAAALRENLPELRARLQSQGMQIEQLSVEVEKDPQSGERSFSGHQSGAEQGGAGYSSGDRWQSPRQSSRPRPTRDHSASAVDNQTTTPQIASQRSGVDVKL